MSNQEVKINPVPLVNFIIALVGVIKLGAEIFGYTIPLPTLVDLGVTGSVVAQGFLKPIVQKKPRY